VIAASARRLREIIGIPELAILLISLVLFAHYFAATWEVRYYDENHYLSLATLLWDEGPLARTDLHAQRTYLYPVLLGALLPLAGFDPQALKTLVALLQYAVFASTVFWLAGLVSDRDTPHAGRARRAVLVAGLWNPYLVQATVLLLTDSLAACGVAFSIAAAWRCRLDRIGGALGSVGVAATAAMLRPAALPALALVPAIVALRIGAKRDVALGAFAWRGALCLVALVPQLVLNVRNFGLWSVLPQLPMYSLQQSWALHRLRWVTSVDPRSPGGIKYWNPIGADIDETIFSAIVGNPPAFVVAYAAHWFHLLDWGYVEIFVRDLYAPSRLVGSVFVYTVWALVVWGAAVLWRRPGKSVAHDGHWLVLGLAALGYAAFIATTQMETRYAYPVMMLVLAFVGPGAVAALGWLGGGARGRRWLLGGVVWSVAVTALLGLSLRLDWTSGKIDWFAHYFG
jgi:hypothetical protein